MIEGGWAFVWTAYVIALSAIAALTLTVLVRLSAWSRRARDLDRPK